MIRSGHPGELACRGHSRSRRQLPLPRPC